MIGGEELLIVHGLVLGGTIKKEKNIKCGVDIPELIQRPVACCGKDVITTSVFSITDDLLDQLSSVCIQRCTRFGS
jgi:hypothetical protein